MKDVNQNKPFKPEDIRNYLNEISLELLLPNDDFLLGAFRATIGEFHKVIGGDTGRHIVYWWLFFEGRFENISSKDLTRGQKYAIVCWVDHNKIDDNTWVAGEYFSTELKSVLDKALLDMLSSPQELTEKQPDAIIDIAHNLGGVVSDIPVEKTVAYLI